MASAIVTAVESKDMYTQYNTLRVKGYMSNMLEYEKCLCL